MYPWLWFWSPQFHFPFSGSVAQRIDPDFFAQIPPEAGNGEVEKQIADIASYGRQLGWLTEVLLSRTSPDTVPPEKGAEAQAKLEATYHEIETVKRVNKAKLALGHGRARKTGGDRSRRVGARAGPVRQSHTPPPRQRERRGQALMFRILQLDHIVLRVRDVDVMPCPIRKVTW